MTVGAHARFYKFQTFPPKKPIRRTKLIDNLSTIGEKARPRVPGARSLVSGDLYFTPTASISTRAPIGRAATW